MSANGKRFNQKLAKKIIQNQELTIICGRYEGIDQRVLDYHNIEEVILDTLNLKQGKVC